MSNPHKTLQASKIAKILARATSPEQNEALTAIDHAYKRMKHDGVTMADLLELPTELLYQDTLIRLVDVILRDQATLSPAQKREAYAEYVKRIVNKFSGQYQNNQNNQQNQEDQQNQARREAEERWKRRQEEEANPKGNTQEQQRQEKQQSQSKNQGQTHYQTPPSNHQPQTHASYIDALKAELKKAISSGGILWLLWHQPTETMRLMAASLLWGMALSAALITLAAIFHAITNTSPWIDVRLARVFSLLTAGGFLWRMRAFLQ